MRIAIVGLGTESSTFSRHVTKESDFAVHKDGELLNLMRTAGVIWSEDDVEWIPVFRAFANPGGPVERAPFDRFVSEIVDGITATGGVDGVYVELHGAMKVQGMGHAEEHLLSRIREAAGPDAIISASMDPHGNFSRELAEIVDLAVAFRHAPHIDTWQIRHRAVEKLIQVLRSGRRPLKAWVRVPVLLPGERTSTVVEPAKSVFGALEGAVERYGVTDASLWVGFAWADEDRNAAAVLVTGHDEDAILACASEIAISYWEKRHEFAIVSDRWGDWDSALDYALTRPAAPLYITDSGDNVTAGSSGDITYALERTLSRGAVADTGLRILFGGLTDPDTVQAARAAGEGAVLTRGIGASLDARYAPPVLRDWQIVRVTEEEGAPAVLLRSGPIDVLVQDGRWPFISPEVGVPGVSREEQQVLWTPIDDYDVVVTKNGYLFPDQAKRAGSWFMAVTPGGSDLDPARLKFGQVWRPIIPLDEDFEADLTPVLL